MKVHNELGPGFTEKVYQEALAIEFTERGIPFTREKEMHAIYKGIMLEGTFIPDFICYDKIILELKAAKELLPEHSAQLFNYLRGANMRLGLLVNFNHYPGVDIRRIAL